MLRPCMLRSVNVIAQIPGGSEDLDQLVCYPKMLRCSIGPTDGGGSAFIAQVKLYSTAVGTANCPAEAGSYSQAGYATGENHEWSVLRQLLGELDLEGVLIQADALHTQRPFLRVCGKTTAGSTFSPGKS